MLDEKTAIVANYYFCSAKIRPSGCLKVNSLCCMHCDESTKCKDLKHIGTKPCTTKIISYDEFCEFSI